MGGPCASQIDFPGAEFTPAAAVSGTCGAPESGTERERELCRVDPKRAPATPHRPLGSASPSRVCAVRPPSFPPRHTLELKTESRAHGSEVAETLEGGRAPLGVLARPGILRHQQACLRVRVRVQGPPSHLALRLAPAGVGGAVAHNFELVRDLLGCGPNHRRNWFLREKMPEQEKQITAREGASRKASVLVRPKRSAAAVEGEDLSSNISEGCQPTALTLVIVESREGRAGMEEPPRRSRI
ncbi:hypothetical protein PAL_GLEAN10005537 [Pteropus alecto]|uniref:Uncharacterized protein n=1 Tax=Pteropus alecto TaxID=9402 RepID=L5KUX0_PTEAL|nr:hypothetical protein PAL_GLEAN10005537 [Pteropus alecto]